MLAAAIGVASGAQAQEAPAGAPVIREIAFDGNKVTRPRVMLREMSLHVGDRADPVEVERSRQGVQDLGLFRSVAVVQQPVPGGVRLVFKVKEKYYILPLPRTDYSSDGGYAYGAQLRWNNVWGLNHTFAPYYERRQPSEGSADPEKRGIQTRGQLRYSAPFIFDTEYSAGFAAAYFRTPYLTPDRYEATSTQLSASLSRKLTGGHGSQGWTGGTALAWEDDRSSDPVLHPAKGHATSLSVGARYRDLHFNVYSDEGVTYGFNVSGATDDLLSDYDFQTLSFSGARYLRIGETHRNLNFLLETSARFDGAAYGGDAYTVGGTETLRGFEPETKKGDAYYAATVEYLHPVFRNSIRALVVLDAANAFASPQDADLDKAYVSAGLGVRFRIQAFVALDLEIGVAWPLNGGGPRLFASKV